MREKPEFITSEWKEVEATSNQAGVTEYMDVPGGWIVYANTERRHGSDTYAMCFVPYPLILDPLILDR
jgi:hypothetical protein